MARGRLDPSAAVILAQHHQRFDGSGFAGVPGEETTPAGGSTKALAGQAIHVHARITMAADVFCQFLFGDPAAGPGRVLQPMVRALWQVQQPAVRKWFDPAVHQAIMSLLWPFVEGMAVTMQDHRQAVVVKIPEAGSCYPEVERIGGGGRGGGPRIAERFDRGSGNTHGGRSGTVREKRGSGGGWIQSGRLPLWSPPGPAPRRRLTPPFRKRALG